MKSIYTLLMVLLAGAAHGQTVSNWVQEKGTGCKVYNSAPEPDESIEVTGNCVNGYLEGQGTVIWFLRGQFNQRSEGFHVKGKLNGRGHVIDASGNQYTGEFKDSNPHGQGQATTTSGDRYVGEFKDGKPHGQGSFVTSIGEKYIGEVKEGAMNGLGVIYDAQGNMAQSGVYKDNKLVKSQPVDPSKFTRIARTNTPPAISDARRVFLEVDHSQPNADGDVTIQIQTNADTASLKINGEEQGGRADGQYAVKRVARAGQATQFLIIAKDVHGNTDAKTITVSRELIETKVSYQQLNPNRIKRQPERDAVAVIIGISNYKSLPKADYAKDDAQVFFDYAIRALGVRPGNIKLLMDEQADAEEIYTAFKTWLPARVKSTTDVYVFYSGHGLPTQDGSGLYWLPQRANRDVISKTAILLQDINTDIEASKPRSVTIFMDACYSGQARGGETLVASARPISLKSQPTTFPKNFTVISASQADQISSSSPELQHGIFSYYLMRGMEGEADLNKDGKITLDETQKYLSENVSRHARLMNRQQEPQVIGNSNLVLVGRP